MSTSKLQRYVSTKLNQLSSFEIKENIRPDWLITKLGERLELDFYIEELNVAIEVQGAQHYIYVPFMHGNYSGFRDRIRRDEFKREICQLAGIELIEVSNQSEADDTIQYIESVGKMPSSDNEAIQIIYQDSTIMERLSPMYHKIEIIGHLGNDPELSETQSGQQVCNMFIAVNRTTAKKERETIWFRVAAWGKDATFLSSFAKKGDVIFCEGQLNLMKDKDTSYNVTSRLIKVLRTHRPKDDIEVDKTLIDVDVLTNIEKGIAI